MLFFFRPMDSDMRRKLETLERLKWARLRVDHAPSDAARAEALREYDLAIREFQALTQSTMAAEEVP
jgi:hypothetical protein